MSMSRDKKKREQSAAISVRSNQITRRTVEKDHHRRRHNGKHGEGEREREERKRFRPVVRAVTYESCETRMEKYWRERKLLPLFTC